MKKLHYLLIASSLNIIIANISPNYAKNNAEYLCSNGSSTALCKAELNNDALTLTLKDGKRLTARRLGNWKQNNTGGGVERSCNVRIDLGNDFVYGLLKVNSKQGTSLIWPQRQINIRNLKDWKKWTVIIKRNYTPNCHSPFNFQLSKAGWWEDAIHPSPCMRIKVFQAYWWAFIPKTLRSNDRCQSWSAAIFVDTTGDDLSIMLEEQSIRYLLNPAVMKQNKINIGIKIISHNHLKRQKRQKWYS